MTLFSGTKEPIWSDSTESDAIAGVDGQSAVPTAPVLSDWSTV